MHFSINCSPLICSPTVEFAILREATSETCGPRVYLPSLIFQHLVIFIAFYFTLRLYHKNTKNIILSYLPDVTLVCDRVGIDNPLSRWLRGFI